MYKLKAGIKENPQKRWNLPDRIFFGHGACPILAGVYMDIFESKNLYGVWIKPISEFSGSHIFVTDGETTFDYHGYSQYNKLINHHRKGWSKQFNGWDCTYSKVDFNLLNTQALNSRKMRGYDQYLYNPIPRAKSFIARFEHMNKFKCTS